ncbi:hypothetical protein ACIBF6_13665 [Streptosporangium amethystogenes]|uniref:hypothetical protein n=1 Tax=Streptosporangium amethystogenes TaxID=2002 RepID=UPI0037B28589
MALAGTLLPVEIGIHNATLSIAVALSLPNSSQTAVPAATYGVPMFFTAAGAGFLLRSRTTEPMPLESSECSPAGGYQSRVCRMATR